MTQNLGSASTCRCRVHFQGQSCGLLKVCWKCHKKNLEIPLKVLLPTLFDLLLQWTTDKCNQKSEAMFDSWIHYKVHHVHRNVEKNYDLYQFPGSHHHRSGLFLAEKITSLYVSRCNLTQFSKSARNLEGYTCFLLCFYKLWGSKCLLI